MVEMVDRNRERAGEGVEEEAVDAWGEVCSFLGSVAGK